MNEQGKFCIYVYGVYFWAKYKFKKIKIYNDRRYSGFAMGR